METIVPAFREFQSLTSMTLIACRTLPRLKVGVLKMLCGNIIYVCLLHDMVAQSEAR
jgi:hypothetical protein